MCQLVSDITHFSVERRERITHGTTRLLQDVITSSLHVKRLQTSGCMPQYDQMIMLLYSTYLWP